MIQKHFLRTHNLPQNLVGALHVKNMDVIPGQKCVKTDQINLGLLAALCIQNVSGQKICKPRARSLSQVNTKYKVITELGVR